MQCKGLLWLCEVVTALHCLYKNKLSLYMACTKTSSLITFVHSLYQKPLMGNKLINTHKQTHALNTATSVYPHVGLGQAIPTAATDMTDAGVATVAGKSKILQV